MGPTSMPAAVAVPLPPGGPIEIVFSFDTTGSMSECLDQVRGQLAHVIERLFADIPGLRISVFAHGDYCDLDMYGYVTKYVDFSTDVGELCRFVNEVGGTGGGDFEECYELVLRQVREQLSWQPGTQRALVMIGDATPHEPDAAVNELHIDWRNETSRLVAENGVHIYAVQCLQNKEADGFYEHLAEATGGRHLRLDELTNIVDIMMAICYREKGVEYFEAYEMEVRNRDGSAIRADVDRMFATLKDQPQPSGSAPLPAMTSADDDDDVEDADDVASTASTPPGPSGLTDTPPATPAGLTRPRAGSVSSAVSSRSSASSRSSGSTSRRSSGVRTRSTAHPMALRTRDPRSFVRQRDPRAQPKRTPTQRCLEKALRERQQGDDFLLGDLEWTRWQQAITQTPPASSRASSWVQRHRGTTTTTTHTGGCRKHLLYPDMSTPAVYEVAIQAPNSQTKTPVLASVTQGISPNRNWERVLLATPHVKEQVEKVIQKGCKLYVRRAEFTKDDVAPIVAKYGTRAKAVTSDSSAVSQLRGLLTRGCDYAWRARYNADTSSYTQRPLKRKNIKISQ